MQPDNERRLTRIEAAAFLSERGFRVAYATMNKYATVGGGPTFEYFGRRPLYKPTDLLAWVATKTSGPRRHTSHKPAAETYDPASSDPGRGKAIRRIPCEPAGRPTHE
jgi:hypothetical protein